MTPMLDWSNCPEVERSEWVFRDMSSCATGTSLENYKLGRGQAVLPRPLVSAPSAPPLTWSSTAQNGN